MTPAGPTFNCESRPRVGPHFPRAGPPCRIWPLDGGPMRSLALIAVCGFAMLCTACGASNNKGKIVGKWKMVAGPGISEMIGTLESADVYFFLDFKNDGTMAMGIESSDPKIRKNLAKLEKSSMVCKYRLLSGDGIEVYDVPEGYGVTGLPGGGGKDSSRSQVTINGDLMLLKDETSTHQLIRIK